MKTVTTLRVSPFYESMFVQNDRVTALQSKDRDMHFVLPLGEDLSIGRGPDGNDIAISHKSDRFKGISRRHCQVRAMNAQYVKIQNVSDTQLVWLDDVEIDPGEDTAGELNQTITIQKETSDNASLVNVAFQIRRAVYGNSA